MSSWNGLAPDDIVILVPFFQDRKAGENLRQNIIEFQLNSIWADGPFHKFKHDTDRSTDGFREIIATTPRASLIDAGECYGYEKWNLLLREAAKQGFKAALLMGCDEYLQGNFKEFTDRLTYFLQREGDKWTKEPQRIKVPFVEHHIDGQYNRELSSIERIFFMPGLIRAKGTHWLFYSASDAARGKTTWMDPFPDVVPGITIHHDDSIRDPQREKLMVEYQNRNIQDEYENYYQQIFKMQRQYAETKILSPEEVQVLKRIQSERPRKLSFREIKMFYANHNPQDEIIRDVNKETIKAVMDFKPKSVFEFGCNNGKNLSLLPPGLSHIGIDLNDDSIRTTPFPGLSLVHADEKFLSSSTSNSFDVCFTCSVINHIPEPEAERIVEQLQRLCSKGVILTEHNHEVKERWFNHDYYKWGFNKIDEVKSLHRMYEIWKFTK